MSTLTLDDVLTDAQLADEVGETTLGNMQPALSVRDDARQAALNDVEAKLLSLTPPIDPSTLQDVSEIRDATRYRALIRLLRNAKTHKDDRWGQLQMDYEREYTAAFNRKFTVSGGTTVSTGLTITLSRR